VCFVVTKNAECVPEPLICVQKEMVQDESKKILVCLKIKKAAL